MVYELYLNKAITPPKMVQCVRYFWPLKEEPLLYCTWTEMY